MNRVLIRSAICLCAALACSPAFASLWVWESGYGGNDHYYEPVLASATWDQAQASATARGGYLATITSQAENTFVYSLVDDDAYWLNGYGGPWLGGYQPDGASEPAGGWTWISGEAWNPDFTPWWPSQPDNSGGDEDHLHLHGGPAHGGPFWNDLNRATILPGYVIEYDDVPYQEVAGTLGDHTYIAVLDRATWDEAQAAAVARGGYLATITSQAEKDLIYSLVTDPIFWLNEFGGPWLGGYQPQGEGEPAAGWTWINDVEANCWFPELMIWWPSQPDDSGGNEDHLQMHGGPLHGGLFFNDLSNSTQNISYVIEIGAPADCTTAVQAETWSTVKSMFR